MSEMWFNKCVKTYDGTGASQNSDEEVFDLKRRKLMLLGYARVSTEEQSLDRQIDQLIQAGVDPRCIYQEKASGRKSDRPELQRMLSELREGDVILIADLTRISRSTKDLLAIIDRITQKNANIKSIKDTWLDTTTDNPYNSFLEIQW